MTAKKLAVVTAGLSQPSSTRLLADKLADATRSALAGRGASAEATVIELRDLATDVVNNLLTGFPSAALGKAIEAVTHADGLIVVTPIYTGSYSGLFKSFFDVATNAHNTALEGMPVVLAATGGTERHSLVLDYQLRPMFAYLRAAPVPTAVYAASSDWGTAGESDLARRVDRAGSELAGVMAGAFAAPRVDQPLVSTPFEQLLAGN
jgi:FMN reductase